jgi:hypothetical protein
MSVDAQFHDYSIEVAGLKSRSNSFDERISHFTDFWDQFRSIIEFQIGLANKELSGQELKTIELHPQGLSLRLKLGSVECRVDPDFESNVLRAIFSGRNGAEEVKIVVSEMSSPPKASIEESEQYCGEVDPSGAAITVVEKMISLAP